MMHSKACLNPEKRIGEVPGQMTVLSSCYDNSITMRSGYFYLIIIYFQLIMSGLKVGHQFYSRAEMVVLGFHGHWLNGIDYLGVKYKEVLQLHIALKVLLVGVYDEFVVLLATNSSFA